MTFKNIRVIDIALFSNLNRNHEVCLKQCWLYLQILLHMSVDIFKFNFASFSTYMLYTHQPNFLPHSLMTSRCYTLSLFIVLPLFFFLLFFTIIFSAFSLLVIHPVSLSCLLLLSYVVSFTYSFIYLSIWPSLSIICLSLSIFLLHLVTEKYRNFTCHVQLKILQNIKFSSKRRKSCLN